MHAVAETKQREAAELVASKTHREEADTLRAEMTSQSLGLGDVEVMTQLGILLTEIVLLPFWVGDISAVKLDVCKLLLGMPPDYRHFMSANRMFVPILDLLHAALLRAVVARDDGAYGSVLPLLLLLHKASAEPGNARDQINARVFLSPVAASASGAGSKVCEEASAAPTTSTPTSPSRTATAPCSRWS